MEDLVHRHVVVERPAADVPLVILATAYGRIETGAHWPTDVLGGLQREAAGEDRQPPQQDPLRLSANQENGSS